MSEEQHHHLALPQGTRIRDFEFHRVLGHGGFGITYLGWNVTLDIPVAIKEYLPTDLATRKGDQSVVPQSSQVVADFQWGLERFLDEARTLARLQHPNIVRVHHFFEAHSTAYIVMDYVEGEDLSAFLTRKGTLSEAELKAVLYPLLNALEVIHRADFLHRDIKPGNIVLRAVDGSPVLLDFGAARQAIGAKSRSVTSIVTPGYAPIEQYSSRGRQGAWTDIYALGGVCYRALTGQVPEDATDRVRNDPLIPVSQRCAGRVRGAFLSAIDVALSVDEGDRPQSVAAWRAVLESGSAPAQERRQEEERQSTNLPPRLIDVLISQQECRQEETPRRREQVVQRSPLPEQVGLAEEREKFVAEVGREPSPGAVGDEGRTDLHHAAAMNLPALTAYLLNNGADVHAKNKYGSTPLHLAAWEDTSATAEVLLNRGADVHANNNYGKTPLDVAVSRNAHKTAEVLRRYGARNNKSGGKGNREIGKVVRRSTRSSAVSLTVPISRGARRIGVVLRRVLWVWGF